VPACVDRYEGLLHKILRVRWTVADTSESMLEVPAQMTAQSLEKRPMSRSITIEARYHQCSQLLFVRMSGFVHWLIRMKMASAGSFADARLRFDGGSRAI
jgi:hypothetical protein